MDLALGQLGKILGGEWRLTEGETLDDIHNSVPSPECLVTNGETDAAIEVKRLTGDTVFQAYIEAQLSLQRSLVPTWGGFFALAPATDFRLPIDGPLRRWLKREIERVAPTLGHGDKGAIRLMRNAHVSMARADGPGHVFCCHCRRP